MARSRIVDGSDLFSSDLTLKWQQEFHTVLSKCSLRKTSLNMLIWQKVMTRRDRRCLLISATQPQIRHLQERLLLLSKAECLCAFKQTTVLDYWIRLNITLKFQKLFPTSIGQLQIKKYKYLLLHFFNWKVQKYFTFMYSKKFYLSFLWTWG